MPDWLPPILAGTLTLALLWTALALRRLRERRARWDRRLVRELRRWDGRLPPRAGDDR
jgi:hypothetical protein